MQSVFKGSLYERMSSKPRPLRIDPEGNPGEVASSTGDLVSAQSALIPDLMPGASCRMDAYAGLSVGPAKQR